MLKRHFPLFILIVIILAVIAANFSLHTFLLGWDNLAVEFNFGLNIQRSIFSAWQGFQGLGIVAGNGHAADLPRQLLLLPLSFLPLNLIRQIYIFLTLAAGSIGAYFLVKKLLSYKDKNINNLIPALGGLFYLLNLATIQTFYVAFEPFVTHFAALPWLLLSALYFIAEDNKKALLFFIFINILAIPQGQVPTIFFVYLFSLCFFLLVLFIETRTKAIFKKCTQVILLTLILNAFWLLPFIYFFFTNSQVAFNAKINQMSTETVYLQNKEFGNISDVMLLKGFWFNNVDLNSHNQFDYMLKPWKQYLTLPISTIGYLFFGVIILGFASLRKKTPFVIPFSALFLLSFTMLTTNTPPFSWIDDVVRKIPLFNEIFRFPFTKFSTLASLTYAFFFSVGIGKLMTLIKDFKFTEKIRPIFIFFATIILLIIFIFPVFRGKLLYDRIKVKIPNEYFQLFDYLKTKDKTLRIANFPQPTFWGWSYYNWGYDGSGFLWYGIEQPILDRAFDVWNKNNENYYWEISNALYSKNAKLFEDVLSKYNVSLLLLDENIIYPSSPKSLFNNGLKEIINETPQIKVDKSFGKLTLYKVNLKDRTNELKNVDKINPYSWSDNDLAYSEYGNYTTTTKNPNFFYPFRSLFSGKNEENQEFKIKTYSDRIEFSNPLPTQESANLLLSNTTKFISATFSVTNNSDNGLTITARLQTPEIFIESGDSRRKIYGENIDLSLFTIKKPTFPMILDINGQVNFKIDKDQDGIIGQALLLKDQNTVISLNNSLKSLGIETILTESISSQISSSPQEIPIGKIDNNAKMIVAIPNIENYNQKTKIIPSKDWEKNVKNCEDFKKGQVSGKIITKNGKSILELTSENSTACISFSFPTLDHNQGYLTLINNANKQGRTLHFWFLNDDTKNSIVDTYLKKSENLNMSAFVIPLEQRYSLGYSLHLDSQSIGKDKVINDVGEIFVLPIPYELLTSLKISDAESSINNSQTLIYSQSFDSGWKAYTVKGINWLDTTLPFLFGTELKNHVLVNNWANGWVLDPKNTNSKIIVIFWPQYLEYLGFAFLIGALTCTFISMKRKTKQPLS